MCKKRSKQKEKNTSPNITTSTLSFTLWSLSPKPAVFPCFFATEKPYSECLSWCLSCMTQVSFIKKNQSFIKKSLSLKNFESFIWVFEETLRSLSVMKLASLSTRKVFHLSKSFNEKKVFHFLLSFIETAVFLSWAKQVFQPQETWFAKKRLHKIQDPNCELERRKNRIFKQFTFHFEEKLLIKYYKLREEDKQFESHTSHVSLSSIPYADRFLDRHWTLVFQEATLSFSLYYYYSLSSLLSSPPQHHPSSFAASTPPTLFGHAPFRL